MYSNLPASALVDNLQKANAELREARHAALNLMEDAITSREALRINEERMRRQKEAFQAAINGAPLRDSLNLIASIVSEETAARTAFYITDENGAYLHPVMGAGNMAEAYLQQMDGLIIGENSIACGLTSPTGRPALTTNVFKEPLWKPWLHLAEKFEFRGCWSFPIKTRDNKPVGTFVMYFREVYDATPQDITLAEIVTQTAAVIISGYTNAREKARAEDALRQSEERLQLSLKGANIFTWEIDPKTGEAKYSHNSDQVLGFEISKIAKENYIDIHPGDKDFVLQAIAKAVKGEASLDVEYRITHPQTKEIIWVRAQGQLAKRSADDKRVLIGITQNITKRKIAEEALHQSEERYRIALTSANMAAWDWNIREDRIKWNDQHYYLLGLMPDNKEKRTGDFFRFVHPDDKDRISRALMDSARTSGVYKADFRIVRADDKQTCWMRGYGKVVAEHDHEAIRMVGVMYDITEQKRLEQQKEDFIGIASHELKTPVTSIKVYAELLHDMFVENKDAVSANLTQKLDVQVDRLIDLIHALLDTSKISEGELPLTRERFNLRELVEERTTDLQRLSAIHHIVIQSKKETVINADRERIGQVLTNLISNGIKYSPKGGDIAIAWQEDDDEIKVSVRDEGIGISEEAQGKVFDRFFREIGAKTQNYPGMGLGLYITANIVRRHGGKIGVKSKPGEGSTFYFLLPRVAAITA